MATLSSNSTDAQVFDLLEQNAAAGEVYTA